MCGIVGYNKDPDFPISDAKRSRSHSLRYPVSSTTTICMMSQELTVQLLEPFLPKHSHQITSTNRPLDG